MKNTAFRIVTMILTVAFFVSVCTFEPFNLNGKEIAVWYSHFAKQLIKTAKITF